MRDENELQSASYSIFQVNDPLMGYYITKLVGYFLREISHGIDVSTNSLHKEKHNEKAQRFAWVASILTNVTKVFCSISKLLSLSFFSHSCSSF
jgi:membrane protein YqaA with SNARE-associated domain